MNVQERSYSGKLFRPAPEVLVDEGAGLLVVATPWGARSAARKTIQSIHDYFLSARQDAEVTSPFQTLTCLNPTGNTLRASLMLANDLIFREENKTEYLSGVELLAVAFSEREWVWAQLGQPQVFLDRFSEQMTPLGAALDFSGSFSATSNVSLPPLPAEMLGLHSTSNISVRNFHPLPGDRMVLLSRSIVPADLYHAPKNERDLDHLSTRLAEQSPDMPFWLAIVDFGMP